MASASPTTPRDEAGAFEVRWHQHADRVLGHSRDMQERLENARERTHGLITEVSRSTNSPETLPPPLEPTRPEAEKSGSGKVRKLRKPPSPHWRAATERRASASVQRAARKLIRDRAMKRARDAQRRVLELEAAVRTLNKRLRQTEEKAESQADMAGEWRERFERLAEIMNTTEDPLRPIKASLTSHVARTKEKGLEQRALLERDAALLAREEDDDTTEMGSARPGTARASSARRSGRRRSGSRVRPAGVPMSSGRKMSGASLYGMDFGVEDEDAEVSHKFHDGKFALLLAEKRSEIRKLEKCVEEETGWLWGDDDRCGA